MTDVPGILRDVKERTSWVCFLWHRITTGRWLVSKVFYFHPDPWGNDPILRICWSSPTRYGLQLTKFWFLTALIRKDLVKTQTFWINKLWGFWPFFRILTDFNQIILKDSWNIPRNFSLSRKLVEKWMLFQMSFLKWGPALFLGPNLEGSGLIDLWSWWDGGGKATWKKKGWFDGWNEHFGRWCINV